MKEKPFCFLYIFAVAIFMAGCPRFGHFYEEDLGNGYAVWATDVMEEAAVFKINKRGTGGAEVVPSVVFAYGWNDVFILAKQHPLNERDIKVDTSITNWYIVEVVSGKVHGPLDEGEFNKLRAELKVPAEISFKTIMSFKTIR
jgi:hypothetical protein